MRAVRFAMMRRVDVRLSFDCSKEERGAVLYQLRRFKLADAELVEDAGAMLRIDPRESQPLDRAGEIVRSACEIVGVPAEQVRASAGLGWRGG